MFDSRYDDYFVPHLVHCDSMEADFCYAKRPPRRPILCNSHAHKRCCTICLPDKGDCFGLLALLIAILI